MFPVFLNNGTQEMPDDDIIYIVCKEGIYLKKKLGIMESITPVTKISFLDSVNMMATMHIKPIPGTVFAPVIDFFAKVYDEHHGEAIVLLFYNEEKRTYKIVPPAQKVTFSGVDYNRAMTIEDHIMVGDIHSHASFSAFHSGIDDADEKSFDGLHITIGNNNDKEVSISTSIVSNGQRFIADTMDYVNGLKLTVDIDEEIEKPVTQYYVYDRELKRMVPKASTKTTKVKRFDKRFVSTVSAKYRKCPDAWMDLVEKGSYSWGSGGSRRYHSGGGVNYWKNWDTDKFDRNAWNQAHDPAKLPVKTTQRVMTPPTSGGFETKVDDKKVIPCTICPFKETALDWALDQITSDMSDDDGSELSKYIDNDGNPIDWYECEKCTQVFSTIEEMPVCPVCKIDDFLILMDEGDIEINDGKVTFKEDTDPSIWYECKSCDQVFESSIAPICPSCKKGENIELLDVGLKDAKPKALQTYTYKCKECASETDTLNDGHCPFCNGEVMDSIDAEALRAANEADQELLTPIPLQVPDENRIPLGTGRKHKKPGVLASLFQRRNKKT